MLRCAFQKLSCENLVLVSLSLLQPGSTSLFPSLEICLLGLYDPFAILQVSRKRQLYIGTLGPRVSPCHIYMRLFTSFPFLHLAPGKSILEREVLQAPCTRA